MARLFNVRKKSVCHCHTARAMHITEVQHQVQYLLACLEYILTYYTECKRVWKVLLSLSSITKLLVEYKYCRQI